MSNRPEYVHVCCLIEEYLRPYIEQVKVPLTEENEKHLLIALSQVVTQIQLWTHQFDSDCDNDTIAKPAGNRKFPTGSKLHSDDHHCLTKIMGDLMILLAVQNQYVLHLAGNTIVVIFEFVVALGSNWCEFMHLLCLCLELAICNAYSSSFVPQKTKVIYLGCDSSSFTTALKPTLKSADWFSVAGITRVLRNILKRLKDESDVQLLELYLDSISACLSNVHWDLLDDTLIRQNGEALRSSSADPLLCTNVAQPESKIMLKGNLVQFFCSLVEQSGFVEDAAGSKHKHSVILKISNLLPKILSWCLGQQGDSICISQYFSHKILMLMIRLSFQIHLEGSILKSWLHLIDKYFQEFLLQPITQLESDQDDCLEGSPFLASLSIVGKQSLTSRHLQRLAVFLFLKCSFSLICLKEKQCVQGNLKSCMSFNLNWDLECCSRKEGLSELYEWLRGHLHVDIFVDHKVYFERCTSFALSFIQLYMHEDDILFEVLLQLSCVPFCSERLVHKGGTFQDVKNNMLFLVSDIFNPIHLFHLFLAELLYDHQVLLDYLIGKDTGAISAEYLLRCLRVVCDSWSLFVEFSVGGKVTNQSSCKKRKTLVNVVDLLGEGSSASMKGDGIPVSHKKDRKRGQTFGSKHCRTNRTSFDNARDCLLSLKKSVENLHQKNLFPYDPRVLLKRLTTFQALCFEPQKISTSEHGGII